MGRIYLKKERYSRDEEIGKADYDIKSMVDKIENIYLN